MCNMSEWHKWDLHIHTPETKMHDDFKDEQGSKSNKEEIWKRYCRALNSYNADVLGITDYFSADNFFKLQENRKKWGLNDNIVLFPNIETRVNDLVSKKRVDSNKPTSYVNIHIIFQPNVTKKRINKFLSYLTVTKTDGQQLNFKDDLDEIIEKDRRFTYLPTTSKLLEALRGTFGEHYRENVLLMIPNSGDGISLKNGNGSGNGKDFVTGNIDFLQARTNCAQKDREYTLKKENNHYERIFASITGCDAHSIETIEKFPVEATTWIKADTTFEGLKQITYEPETRVKIQELKPQKDMQTRVIKSIDLPGPYFNKGRLVFSEGLNTIIGGRSSGKSILLSIIANVSSDQNNFKLSSQNYNNLVNTLSKNCELRFADGRISDCSDKIEFIYQDGLQEIARNSQKRNDFLKKILSTIQESNIDKVQANEDVFHKKKRDIFTQSTEKLRLIDQDIKNSKDNLDEQQNDILIKKNIHAIANKLRKIKKDSAVLNEEQLEIIINQIKQLNNEIKEKDELYQILKQVYSINAIKVNPQLQEFKDKIPEFFREIEDKVNDLNKRFSNILKEKSMVLKNDIKNKKTEQKNIIEGKLYQDYLNIKEKTPNIESLENSMQVQEKELAKYRKNINSIDNLTLKRQKCLKELTRNSLFGCMLKKVKIFSNNELDIEYGLRVNFKKFEELCENIFKVNSKVFKEKLADAYLDETSKKTPFDIIVLFSKCLKFNYNKSVEMPFRKGRGIYDWISEFSNMDFLEPHYSIRYRGQDFTEMSEGKQAFVLLLIKLSLSEEEKPLLIDQPEDELDNKAIYDDLVKYFRKQKKTRQLFVVTHNANIVVGADSECIIVAEEKADQTSPNGRKFYYSQGSIEDESTQTSICEILEGGEIAFKARERRYTFSRS